MIGEGLRNRQQYLRAQWVGDVRVGSAAQIACDDRCPVAPAGVVHVKEAAVAEVRMKRKAQQTSFATGHNQARNIQKRGRQHAIVLPHLDLAGLLDDE